MANFIVAEFKPLYIPFDYSFPPCKEYVPHVPFVSTSPLRAVIIVIESALRFNNCTPKMVQKLISLLEINHQAPFEPPETIKDAENLLDDLRDRVPELFE